MINLTFNNTNVALTPNEDGLYNLNLVHRASGGADKNKPNRWTRSLNKDNSQRPYLAPVNIKGLVVWRVFERPNLASQRSSR